MNKLFTSKTLNILRNVNGSQKRLFITKSIIRSSSAHQGHHEHGSNDHHDVTPTRRSFFGKLTELTDFDKRGYSYRSIENMDGYFGKFLGEVLLTFLWFWIFYNLMVRPADVYGHHPYPDTSKWTDAELGIKDE